MDKRGGRIGRIAGRGRKGGMVLKRGSKGKSIYEESESDFESSNKSAKHAKTHGKKSVLKKMY